MRHNKKRILHITPHMGGGVGRVIKNFCDDSMKHNEYSHEIICLDYANESALAWSERTSIPVHSSMSQNNRLLLSIINNADIVHWHWWNHPLNYELITCLKFPICRVIMWSHQNGHKTLNIFNEKVLNYPDIFVVGTPYSLEADVIKGMSSEWRKQKLRVVFASPGYRHIEHIELKEHDGFNIGYIGTVDYMKMHPDYLKMNLAANIKGAKFIVCGGPSERRLRQEVHAMSADESFDIRGQVSDISSVLSVLDVFGYPLAPEHYGASEVALIEAQAAGVVPVVLDNGCERYIVEDGRTGIVASSTEEYSQALKYLYDNPEKRKVMSQRARNMAREKFQIKNTTEAWHDIYAELLELSKTEHRFTPRVNDEVEADSKANLFFNAIDKTDERGLFISALKATDKVEFDYVLRTLKRLPPIFRSNSNGSIFQYRNFFPDDSGINFICGLFSLITETSDRAESFFDKASSYGDKVEMVMETAGTIDKH